MIAQEKILLIYMLLCLLTGGVLGAAVTMVVYGVREAKENNKNNLK